jgi:AAHS family 4-hydroxybenzoate transporter-like MFS transporter
VQFERQPGATAVDVGAVMDGARYAGLPARVSAFTVFALVFDGLDIQSIAFAAPRLLEDWQITRGELAPVLAAGLVGMAVGAVLLGNAGDRIGRRRALVSSMLTMALASLLSAFARDPFELTVYRFLTGIGLGGALPNATALMAEFAPLAVRNLAVAATVVGVPIGGMLGAQLATALVPRFGWQSIFVAGALLPGALAALMWIALPESPRYLAQRPERVRELARLLNRVVRAERYRGDEVFRVHEPAARRGHPRELFTPELRYDTLIVWIIFTANLFAVFAYFNWLPTVLTGVGLPLATANLGSFVFNLGGVFGALAGAGLMTRLGSRRVLATLAALAVGSALALAGLPLGAAPERGVVAMLWTMAVAGACVNGIQVGMYAVAAHVYPTAIRATGVGWALGFARLGGVLSAFAGSALLALDRGTASFFAGIALVLLLVLGGVILLRTHIPPARTG